MKQKITFVDHNRLSCSVKLLCRYLHISRSAYYYHKTKNISKRQQANSALLRAIITAHQKYPAMGLDSLFHFLHPSFGASRSRIHRLMQQYNIHSIRCAAYKRTTNSNHLCPIAANILDRNFNVNKPDTVWVGDITYIRTDEGWLYLAIVKDLCSKKIVGYSFSDHINMQLTCNALRMAVNRRKPNYGLLFHSDRGIQYAGSNYRRLLAHYNIQQSMSRRGNPYDNAVAENFFNCLKCEFTYFQHFRTRKQAQSAIFRYIETYYNAVRPHSGIGWKSPNDFEKNLCFFPAA